MAEKAEPRTAWERFRDATKQVLSVPKEELEKREAEWRKKRAAKKRRRRL